MEEAPEPGYRGGGAAVGGSGGVGDGPPLLWLVLWLPSP